MPGLFATRRNDLERVFRLLAESGLPVTASLSWTDFLRDLAGHDVVILGVPWLDVDLPTAELRRIVRDSP